MVAPIRIWIPFKSRFRLLTNETLRSRVMALALLLAIPATEGEMCFGAGKPNVLLLHSYHLGFSWTDEIDRSIRSTFKAAGVDAEFYVEYMDAKRHENEETLKNLVPLLAGKYAHIPIKVVIASDDNAFEFLLKHHTRVFPRVPVIFWALRSNWTFGSIQETEKT